MKRLVTQVNLSSHQRRVRVRLEADPCEEIGPLANFHKFHLLQTIVNEPTLVSCDLEPFETLKMFYAGDRWVVESEAIIEQKPSGG